MYDNMLLQIMQGFEVFVCIPACACVCSNYHPMTTCDCILFCSLTVMSTLRRRRMPMG
jgi:hypothetical protein